MFLLWFLNYAMLSLLLSECWYDHAITLTCRCGLCNFVLSSFVFHAPSFNPSTCLFIPIMHPSISSPIHSYHSFYPYIHVYCTHTFIYSTFFPLLHPSIHPSIHPSELIHPSVDLPLHPLVHPTIFLSMLPFFVFISARLQNMPAWLIIYSAHFSFYRNLCAVIFSP